MTLTMELLRAKEMGVKEFRTNISKRINDHKLTIVTSTKNRKKVLIDYDRLADVLELIEELEDKGLVALVREGRAAIGRGEKEISVL